jgi:adenine-specific DNA-methyltransferase
LAVLVQQDKRSWNHEDNGHRKYILIQMPEATDPRSEPYKAGYKKISDITIERNKRVIDKIKAENRGEVPPHLGFKVFKLAPSHFPRVEFAPDPHKTDEENIDLLKKYIDEKEAELYKPFNHADLMSEILLKKGFSLNYTLVRQMEFTHNTVCRASDGDNNLLICLDVQLDMETVAYFQAQPTQRFLCLERSLDTTKKWHLKQALGDRFVAF